LIFPTKKNSENFQFSVNQYIINISGFQILSLSALINNMNWPLKFLTSKTTQSVLFLFESIKLFSDMSITKYLIFS